MIPTYPMTDKEEYDPSVGLVLSDEPLKLTEDIRDLLLGWEQQKCPCCNGTMTFEELDIANIEAYCENDTGMKGCYVIYTNFIHKKE